MQEKGTQALCVKGFSVQKDKNPVDNAGPGEDHDLVWNDIPGSGCVSRWGGHCCCCVQGEPVIPRGETRGYPRPCCVQLSLSSFLCYHPGILLQNVDILSPNLPLLSYWSWLCLSFWSFPNTISVFTCSSQRGNYMWKHSIRRWYFVAMLHKPCVYMGFLRRIQSISPFCDASTSISNGCSKSLCFVQK